MKRIIDHHNRNRYGEYDGKRWREIDIIRKEILVNVIYCVEHYWLIDENTSTNEEIKTGINTWKEVLEVIKDWLIKKDRLDDWNKLEKALMDAK
jgi:hypothetical protein